jgi:hypothetical protein
MRTRLGVAIEVAARFSENDGVDEGGFGGEAAVQRRAADPAATSNVFHCDAPHSDVFGLLDRGRQDASSDVVGPVELGEHGRLRRSKAPHEICRSARGHVAAPCSLMWIVVS